MVLNSSRARYRIEMHAQACRRRYRSSVATLELHESEVESFLIARLEGCLTLETLAALRVDV